MIYELSLPRNLWPFAVQYTQEILNKLPIQVLPNNTTLYQAFYLKKPLVTHFQIFGYWAHVHVPDNKQGKLDAKIIEDHFVGLSQNRKDYIVNNSQNLLRVYVSHDITFVETSEISKCVTI